jgi:hypothetical protein
MIPGTKWQMNMLLWKNELPESLFYFELNNTQFGMRANLRSIFAWHVELKS